MIVYEYLKSTSFALQNVPRLAFVHVDITMLDSNETLVGMKERWGPGDDYLNMRYGQRMEFFGICEGNETSKIECAQKAGQSFRSVKSQTSVHVPNIGKSNLTSSQCPNTN